MTIELKKRIFTSLILILLLTGMYLYTYIMIPSLLVIGIIAWIEFYALISKILIQKKIAIKFLLFFYKVLSLIFLSTLIFLIILIESYYLDLKIYLLYSLLVAILSDIGGLVFGKTFKGKKLTKISPNKTISGSIGSIIFSLILVPLFYNDIINFDSIMLVYITIIISITSQLGDLFISYLKRKAKVKNTSDILPGHGGILDRIDGIIFAIPMGVFLFNIL